MALNLTTLRFFLTVSEEGSIAQAARKENISPSAISKRLSDVEAELGVTLFERTARGLVPTPAAYRLLRHARRILRDMRMIEEDIAEYVAGGGGTIRVASTMTAVCQYLPQVLRSFSARYPRIGFQIDEMNSDEIVKAVRDKRHDIGIVFWERSEPELEIIPFVVDQLGVVMPIGHSLAGCSELWLRDILPYDLVGMRPGSDLERRLETAAIRAGESLKLRTRVGAFDAAFQLVGAGMGLAVVPTGYMALLGDRDRFRAVPLRDDWARRRLRIVLPRRGYVAEPTRLLVSALCSEKAVMPG